MPGLPLKDYQKETLKVLREYAAACRRAIEAGRPRPERDAFEEVTGGRDYYRAPQFDGVPYVCLRVPTGGGKTLLAAHAIGVVGRELLRTDTPTCLWVVPTTTILNQTLRALRKPGHPYREALLEEVRHDVEVMTIEEALQTRRSVLTSTAVVIVTTLQSYRVRDERTGEEANRRVYRDNGYLSEMFDNLPPQTRTLLAADDRGNVDLSLANALMLRRPIVIMDEAHNARTPVSFESLARFGPSMVIELTATPHQDHDPERDQYASNVLHAVSALQLKNEGMIKLPIELESRGDWLEVLAATRQRREDLERIAREYAAQSGRFIRPIALIQAQPQSGRQETHTPKVVKRALIDQLGVPEREVRICTGTVDEVGDEDLMSAESDVRYIITVDKLREGWDCPYAYVLGSIGNAATPTAVEQLLGRVLRMPSAEPTGVPALDRASAFVLSDDVLQTAANLRDRLIERCGFDARSAADALRVRATAATGPLGFGSIPVTGAPTGDLPAPVRAKIEYDADAGVLRIHGELTGREAAALSRAVPTEEDRRAVEEYFNQMRPAGVAAKAPGEYAPSLHVPQLVLVDGERCCLYEPEELETFAWDLDQCETTLTGDEFATEVRVGARADMDLGGQGNLFTRAAGEVRLKQLELIAEGEDWSEAELVRWLDAELHRGGSFAGLPSSQSQPWLRRVVRTLIETRGAALPILVRRRHALAEVLIGRVAAHGRRQVRKAFDRLIAERPDAVETSPAAAFEIEELRYAPYETHESAHRFQKHAFKLIGAMNGEEAECAARIDAHPNVRRWLRNLERESQGGFSLPLSPGRFFTDFIVELVDGRLALVEYKGKDRAKHPDEVHKKDVGELWEQRSGGRCVFAWIVDRNWTTLDRKLSAAREAQNA